MNNNQSLLRHAFFSHIAQTCDHPPAIEISRGSGCTLWDTSGRAYIDLISGISVSSFGHGNPQIIEAVKSQLESHCHVMVFGEYILRPQTLLAKKLAEILPSNLQTVFFTNSGAEAIEGAMKLAKRFTGRTKIIACLNAYHGSTQGALSIMGNESFKQAFRPLLPDISFIGYNDVQSLDEIDDKTACIFLEPIQSETGYLPANPEFIQEVRKRCNENGALMILDEVQSGMGRTGHLFGFEAYAIIPDILILAKAFGGGFPLGAFISSYEIMNSFATNPPLGHLTTFGGHPVSCAASLAAIEIAEKKEFLSEVTRKGKLFRTLLEKTFLPEKISGIGLMLAIHFDSEKICSKLIERCRQKGVLADWFLFAPNALRIAPPLVIDDASIQKSCQIISETYEEIS